MKKNLVGIIIIMLLFATVIPVAMTTNIGDQDTNGSAPLYDADWWAMFHHDPAHSGYSTSTAPETNEILWENTTYIQPHASPAVAESRVVTAAVVVHCYDALLGENFWGVGIDTSFITSSPAIVNGKLYIGGQNNLYCLDLEDGDSLWEQPVTGTILYSSPTVHEDRVFIGSGDNGVAYVSCFDAEDGTLLWENTTSDGAHVYAAPAVEDGKVYVFGAFGSMVNCFDANTGDLLWEQRVSGMLCYGSPAVVDGQVYVSDFFGVVYCLDETTIHWQHDTGGGTNFYSSPAVAYDMVYIGVGSTVYCLDAATGDPEWDFPTGDKVQSSPAVAADKVYVGSDDGNIYCLNAATGDAIWNYDFGAPIGASSPAIAQGILYECGKGTASAGALYAFLANDPPVTPDAPDGPSEGFADIEYTFNASTIDPEGNDIAYIFDWDANGSHDYSDWTEFVPSEQQVSLSHIWDDPGEYQIRVKAKDIYDYESDWSDPLNITIIEGPILKINLITGGKGITVEIKNVGHHTATDVNWNINIDGGIIVPRNGSGLIETIESWKSEEIKMSVFGIGLGILLPMPTITVTAECAEESSAEKTVEAKVFLLWVYIPEE